MKALFITYNQAYNEEIIEVLDLFGQRGFTRWQDVQGRGGIDGIPHMGNHAWPEMNHSLLAFVQDDKVEPILVELRRRDEAAPDLGLRAFVWNVETSY